MSRGKKERKEKKRKEKNRKKQSKSSLARKPFSFISLPGATSLFALL
jgi:hypothetical protein